MKKITLLLLFIGSTAIAQYTAIPDPNFEQALIDLGYDDVLDGQVLTENVENVTELELMELGITDVTGIEDFAALTHLTIMDDNLLFININQNSNLVHLSIRSDSLAQLDVTGNPNLLLLAALCPLLPDLDITQNIQLEYLAITYTSFPEIDLSQNVNLWAIWANYASLTSIDVSNLPLLLDLMVMENQLTTIDVSQNPLLRNLRCKSNQLTQLDLSNNPALSQIDCRDNQIESLDVTNLPLLWALGCSNNPLTELNFNQHQNLSQLVCTDTQLESIDLRNIQSNNFSIMVATNNPALSCIFVDDKNNIPSQWELDPNATYVETEAECDALGIEDFDEISFEIYPNPTEDIIIVDSKTIIKSVTIYDVSGKLVKAFTAQPEYSVSGLSSGIYIIKIDGESGNTIQKLIVQ